mmetsp:Transcript_15984/g.34516  ORF Transcript_15984/g.34516 Transcript_15984/m.34516 type:complete len:216 (+) Transcript_15984:806-1453(+)
MYADLLVRIHIRRGLDRHAIALAKEFGVRFGRVVDHVEHRDQHSEIFLFLVYFVVVVVIVVVQRFAGGGTPTRTGLHHVQRPFDDAFSSRHHHHRSFVIIAVVLVTVVAVAVVVRWDGFHQVVHHGRPSEVSRIHRELQRSIIHRRQLAATAHERFRPVDGEAFAEGSLGGEESQPRLHGLIVMCGWCFLLLLLLLLPVDDPFCMAHTVLSSFMR